MTGFNHKFFSDCLLAAEFRICLAEERLVLSKACADRRDDANASAEFFEAVLYHRLAKKKVDEAAAELAAYMAREAATLRPLRVRSLRKGRR